jgi:hypothetical protein
VIARREQAVAVKPDHAETEDNPGLASAMRSGPDEAASFIQSEFRRPATPL